MIVVRLARPIVANRILGLLDIAVHEPASWRFVFRNCPWIRDEHGERVELVGGLPFELLGHDETERFQQTVLRSAREHAAVYPLTLKEKRKFPLWR